ncbi:MAG: hypothetical protein JWP35_3887 [Caulobacter sp.]|nr:hypothetical protein [Caulobacter sp.]
MSDPLDDEAIAQAMRRSAWVAEHGSREERAGRFLANVPAPAKPSHKATPKPAKGIGG